MPQRKFNIDDIVYYDDDRGRVVETRDTERPVTKLIGFDARVKWDYNGKAEWCWESDLMSEAEYREFDGAGTQA